MVKIETHERWDSFTESEWNGLLARSAAPSLFLTWQWQTGWWDAFGEGCRLRIFGLTDSSGRLIAVLPLYAAPGPHEIWTIVGGADVSDYLDLIVQREREEEAWSALLGHHEGHWDLRGLRDGSPSLSILPALAGSHGVTVRIGVEERCPVLALPSSWEEYLRRLRAKDRHELRRKMRRFERECPGALVSSHTSEDEVDAAMESFMVLHRKSGAGKSRFMDDRMERFFRRVSRTLARAGWMRLWLLQWERAPLAAFICFEYGGAVGLYNSGFDPAHAGRAPGIVLLAQIIRDAIERGVPRFDFLRGEEPYKYAFGPTPLPLYRIEVIR